MSTALANALARLSGLELSESAALSLAASGRATDAVPTQPGAAAQS
ncbi:hypothetical protein OEB99_07995 [Actinotalea sp. M2MS4P-6]|nr:hypothetical protein [Actinotalea sp. M2MS4P-6]MCV2394246.1 hypothetical protein [Actinotalea sp. M2MS4P-6]